LKEVASGLHGNMAQKTELFISSAVRTSNPTEEDLIIGIIITETP
jgi:hypothetical protein